MVAQQKSEEWITVEDAMARLNVSRMTVHRLIKRERLTAMPKRSPALERAQRTLIWAADVERVLAGDQ